MKLESSDIIDQPIEKVYETVRNHLEKIGPYLANVDKIQLESSEDTDGGVKRTNRWFATVPVPGLLKKVLKPEMFSWLDIATWNDADKTVTYVLESTFGKDLFDAQGRNEFRDLGDGRTELHFSCEVEIYPERVPGVPKLLAKKVGPAVESLMKKMLEPNLTSLGTGLKEYYGQK